MKRIGALVCLTTLIFLMSATLCFGADLQLTETYPEKGQTNTSINNLGVKLFFNNSVDNESVAKANAKCFQILDEKGKEIPIRVLYNPKEKGEVLVLADNTSSKLNIKENTTYTLKVSGKFVDNEGNVLGKDRTVEFTTLNQSRSTQVNMIMMVVMFGGIFVFSSRSMKKQKQAEQESKQKEEKVNPYKESKKTGKSVEEIVEKTEKEKAKKAAKQAKKVARSAKEDAVDSDYEEEDNGNYRVKGPRPISATGSTYKTGRKAIAEVKAAEEARRAKKAQQGKRKK